MERESCLRCGGRMAYVGQEKLQLGNYSLLLGSLSNLISGALTVDIYCCSTCKKLEFYAVEPPAEDADTITRVSCPHCGELHDLDDAKCPHCGKRLY